MRAAEFDVKLELEPASESAQSVFGVQQALPATLPSVKPLKRKGLPKGPGSLCESWAWPTDCWNHLLHTGSPSDQALIQALSDTELVLSTSYSGIGAAEWGLEMLAKVASFACNLAH